MIMIISIDKRGSINLPAAIRKELGLKNGDHLELSLEDGGLIMLQPVEIHPVIRLNDKGLEKLKEARTSGIGTMPDWMAGEINDAKADSDQ